MALGFTEFRSRAFGLLVCVCSRMQPVQKVYVCVCVCVVCVCVCLCGGFVDRHIFTTTAIRYHG